MDIFCIDSIQKSLSLKQFPEYFFYNCHTNTNDAQLLWLWGLVQIGHLNWMIGRQFWPLLSAICAPDLIEFTELNSSVWICSVGGCAVWWLIARFRLQLAFLKSTRKLAPKTSPKPTDLLVCLRVGGGYHITHMLRKYNLKEMMSGSTWHFACVSHN